MYPGYTVIVMTATTQPTPTKTADDVLRQFGYTAFQPGQKRAIQALTSGKDVVAIMPTGAGKSLIYQIAAEIFDSYTLVVSPLIALMDDQAKAVKKHGQKALVIHSHKTDAAIKRSLASVDSQQIKLLYVSPERLQNQTFARWLEDHRPSLVVVDEAHCISEWGHDFRSAYCTIGDTVAGIGRPPVLALTATATQFVITDIIKQLRLVDPQTICRSIDRPNLYYDVVPIAHQDQKATTLLNILTGGHTYPAAVSDRVAAAYAACGIIYTATTVDAETIAEWLQMAGLAADFYHGQQSKADRQRVHKAFTRGELQIVTATNAFGMGIDKADVGFIIHYDPPPNIESYYQEAGRAGRGGQFAVCTLLYRAQDLAKVSFSAGASDKKRKEYEQGRQAMMRRYAEQSSCRRAFLLHYFGEDAPEHCAMCDIDRQDSNLPASTLVNDDTEQPAKKSASAPTTAYSNGDEVMHKAWGIGTVQAVDEGRLTVLFKTVGHKIIDQTVADEQHLLRPHPS
jgi:ATP-dependent DNA helicase RecQ